MLQQNHKCINRVGGKLECLLCKGFFIKWGKSIIGKQRFKCKSCGISCIENYSNESYKVSNNSITSLLKEGCGIRSMARLLQISSTTVLKRILSIANAIKKPIISFNKNYEVDEMRTFYKSKTKLLWIVYAFQNETKQVVEFAVGTRTKATLQKVTSTLCMSNANKINTDKLNLYNYIIPHAIHCTKQYGTNNIERKNLDLRTHLKRLNRRTICFSKSLVLLSACLKIYFWG